MNVGDRVEYASPYGGTTGAEWPERIGTEAIITYRNGDSWIVTIMFDDGRQHTLPLRWTRPAKVRGPW